MAEVLRPSQPTDPRGFTEWEHDEDEFDIAADGDDEWDDCSMGPDGQCGQAGSEWCEFDCPTRRRFLRSELP